MNDHHGAPLTLVEFLTARWDEIEALAVTCPPWPWTANDEGDQVLAEDGIAVVEGFALSGQQIRATAAHIVTHDPAHVLADIAAKRKILAAYPEGEPWVSFGDWESCSDSCAADVLTHVLKLLATPFADHPDYREEWVP